ncbi:MAG: MFS transporter [Pseudomonadota bacterium]
MLRAAQSPPRLTTLIVLTALSVLSLNMFAPALPSIADGFGETDARMSLALSGYFALTAVLQLIIGPLSDKIGRRPVMLTSVALFVLASAGCALAPTADIFLAARVAQAAIISGGVLATAAVRDQVSGPEATRLLGIIGTAMALGPMIGPFVGGLTDTLIGWRAVFWLYAALGLLALWLCYTDMGETNRHAGRSIGAQLQLYPLLLGDKRFWAFAGCNALAVSNFHLFILGAPLLGAAFALPTAWIGIAMGATPTGYFLGNIVTTRMAHRLRGAQLILAGRVVTALGMAALVIAALMGAAPAVYFVLMITIGIGNGLTLPSAYAGAMSVKPELAGSAAGLTGAMNVGVGAVVTGLGGLILPSTDITLSLPYALLFLSSLGVVAALITLRMTQD